MVFQAIHSLLSTQLCFCNAKEATGNVELTERDCVPIKFYLSDQACISCITGGS